MADEQTCRTVAAGTSTARCLADTPGSVRACKTCPELAARERGLGHPTLGEWQWRHTSSTARGFDDPPGGMQACQTRSELAARERGEGHPSLVEWQWRRTISFWSSLLFFEGALFFSISCFLAVAPSLGRITIPLVAGGQIWGSVAFLLAAYIDVFCVLNFQVEGGPEANDAGGDVVSSPGDQFHADEPSDHGSFQINPFAYKSALARLSVAGSGPWPYVATVAFFIGCLSMGIGLAAALAGAAVIGNCANLLGCVLFTLGGLAQCIESKVFVSLEITTAWVGALLSLLGGLIYLLAGTVSFVPDVQSYLPSLWFGIGSAVYLLVGSLQLVLWRDNQFGRSFLSVINMRGGRSEKLAESTKPVDAALEHSRWSLAGFVFFHLFTVAAVLSCYGFNMRLGELVSHPSGSSLRKAVEDLIPAVFLHIEIALYVAMVRTPNTSPLRQLCIMMRVLALWLALDSAWTFGHLVLMHVA